MLRPCLGLLDHHLLRKLGDLRHVLHGLPQRRGGKREGAIVVEARAENALAAFLVGARRRRGIFRLDLGGILQPRPGRQAVDLDDAGITDRGLRAERLAHRARDDLQLLLVLVGERHQHDEERHHQAHEIGEGDEPAVTAAAVAVLFLSRHGLSRRCALRGVRRLRPPRLRRPLPRCDDAFPAGRRAASRAPAWDSWHRGSSARRR